MFQSLTHEIQLPRFNCRDCESGAVGHRATMVDRLSRSGERLTVRHGRCAEGCCRGCILYSCCIAVQVSIAYRQWRSRSGWSGHGSGRREHFAAVSGFGPPGGGGGAMPGACRCGMEDASLTSWFCLEDASPCDMADGGSSETAAELITGISGVNILRKMWCH